MEVETHLSMADGESMSKSVFSDEQLREILSKNRGLFDSIESRSADGPAADTTGLDSWFRNLPGGSTEFLERLELAGLSLEEARDRLSRRGYADGDDPDWVRYLSEVVTHVAVASVEFDAVADGERPFSEIVSLLASYAWNHVDWDAFDLLEPSAKEDCKLFIYGRIERLLRNTLYAWFAAFREANTDAAGGRGSTPEPAADETALYDEYISYLEDGGIARIFVEYPVAGELLLAEINDWIESTTEFLTRLHRDREPLGGIVPALDENGVDELQFVGDPHENGRTTMKVGVKDGGTVVYKPRPVGPGVAFNELLEWVNENSGCPDLETSTYVPRDGYGWMEWVSHDRCTSRAEVESFYRRVGSLLALLYGTRFVDGNVENVVASGDQPVVIDLETLADPGVSFRPTDSRRAEVMEESVLRTSLVPMEGGVSDMAGFSQDEVSVYLENEVRYTDVNTDAMELTYGAEATLDGKSLPRYSGDVVRPNEHVDAICRGFREAYEFVLENRERILAPDGPLQSFRDLQCRFIFRSTVTYMNVLKGLRRPERLEDGLSYELEIERLAEPFVDGRLGRGLWPLYRAERESLSVQNVPRFTVNTTGTDVFHQGERIALDVLSRTPFARIREHVRQLSADDCAEQLDYVRAAYDPVSFNDAAADGRPGVPAADGVDLDTADVRAAAVSTVEDVVSARESADEPGSWMLRRKYENKGLEVAYPRPGLFEGKLGIALALAGVGSVTDTGLYADLAEDVAMDAVSDRPDEPDDYRTIGGCRGLGGDIYALTRIGELVDSPEPVDAATDLVEGISTARIEETDRLDVFRGAAGLLLGAISAFEATGSDAALDRAVDAGERLLESVERDRGRVGWRTMGSDGTYSGFIHGNAGIAYALARLGDRTDGEKYVETALDAVRDLPVDPTAVSVPGGGRESAGSEISDGWANGLAGVGLGLVGVYESTGDRAALAKAETALDAGLDEPPLSRHELKRGMAGRVEWFTRASATLERPGLEREIDGRLELVVDSERDDGRGSYVVPWHTSRWTNPSLFNGIGGVAYTFARRVDPGLPSVLLWE